MEVLSSIHVTGGHDKYLGEQGWQWLQGGSGNLAPAPCASPELNWGMLSCTGGS